MNHLFKRPHNNYKVPDGVIDGIMADAPNPLKFICEQVEPNSKVLDIGAGSGILARILSKKSDSIVVDGIEPNETGAQEAKPYYRNLYQGYCQDFFSAIKEEQYDYLVLADVIEHLVDPQDFLNELLSVCKPDVKIILSVPNVAFGSVRLALLNGDFDYVDSGLLEKTHLRFFTEKTLRLLLESVGLKIQVWAYLIRNYQSTEIKLASYPNINIEHLKNELDFNTYQFAVVVGREAVAEKVLTIGEATRPKASILTRLKNKVFR